MLQSFYFYRNNGLLGGQQEIEAYDAGCAPGIVKMYQDYIDGKMELKDVNMAFQARYISGVSGPEKGSCPLSDE